MNNEWSYLSIGPLVWSENCIPGQHEFGDTHADNTPPPCLLQKWSKGKNKDKVNNQVLFDKPTYEKLMTEVTKYKMITPSVLADRLRVRD